MTNIAPHHKAIAQYYAELAQYHQRGVVHELALKSAFQNLLSKIAQELKWMLVPELTLDNGKRPDGAVLDNNGITRGFWEAKDPGDDLNTEIARKIAARYPLRNTIFEDTRRAVLYQGGKRYDEFDLTKPAQLAALLNCFFEFTEPEIEDFGKAVEEFKTAVPLLAAGLKERIRQEHGAQNQAFAQAWASFYALCKKSIDPNMREEQVDDMLVQHLLTERLFRTVFDNDAFTSRNVIAVEIEKVIQGLMSRTFNRREFLKSLDHFYVSIENAAKTLTDWSEKQRFLNMVYERFFQGYDVKDADTHGIVYTPQEIVDFMCASVEEALQSEFGTSLSEPGVQILDPATGTGSYIVNLLRRIAGVNLEHKYRHDLFANEIMLLPYYIASLNIEHEYYARTGQYLPFEGICFADTLDLADRVAHHGLGERSLWVNDENTTRVETEQDARIRVVIGNPPYNVGQENENDNNKNRKYPVVDGRVRETYAKDSVAQNKNKLSDAYVRFIRWATDRLQGRDGIVCFVTNNSFVDQRAFDGMRKHLLQDFTRIYHLDLHGNVRLNPKLSGTTHNVFGIQVGVGITIAIRYAAHTERQLYYYRVPESWRRDEKLGFLKDRRSSAGIDWRRQQPDERHIWLTEGMRPEYSEYVALVDEAETPGEATESIFQLYSNGLKSNRDVWVYDFDRKALEAKVRRFIETYNSEVDRWKRAGAGTDDIDSFVTYDDALIKWSRDLKLDLKRNHYADFGVHKIRQSLYRPFTRQWVFFDRLLNEEVYQLSRVVPLPISDRQNTAICLTGMGAEKPFMVLVAESVFDFHLVGAGAGAL